VEEDFQSENRESKFDGNIELHLFIPIESEQLPDNPKLYITNGDGRTLARLHKKILIEV